MTVYPYQRFETPDSSLLDGVGYRGDTEELEVFFKEGYYTDKITYIGVPHSYFVEFQESTSFGKFYLSMIKPNFKQKNSKIMADEQKNRPKGINKSNPDGKRFIKMRIDVKKLNKDYFFTGEKSVYADITLMMLPDGDVDNYENLGMIVQDVPYELVKKDKTLKGNILGNARENEWNGSGNSEGAPGSAAGTVGVSTSAADDLPF